MKNELVIKHNLDIQSNMEELAVKIQTDIEKKYSLTVTDESVKETKVIMAEINKEKAEFNKKYKEFKALVLEPFTPLDKKAKEIEGYFDVARSALDTQVKKFEEGKREKAKEVCIAYAKKQCEAKEIHITSITISDLFDKLGSLTTANCISGTAKKEIDQRIQAVENEILKAKIEAEEQAKRNKEIADEARIKAEQEAAEREVEIRKQAEKDKEDAVKKALENAKVEEQNKKAVQVSVEAVQQIEQPKRTVVMATQKECDEIFAPQPVATPEEEPAVKIKTFNLVLTKEKYLKFYEFLDQNNIEFEEVIEGAV